MIKLEKTVDSGYLKDEVPKLNCPMEDKNAAHKELCQSLYSSV